MAEWIKDYKSNELYRESFFELAETVFGIKFKPWFEAGHWTDAYIPYSFIEDGKVIANVSMNKMHLVIEGKAVEAIQIGTVMTHPDHRRKGLARRLMEKIFEEWDNRTMFYFLAADDEAITLYQKCGFTAVPETAYEVDALVIPSKLPRAERIKLSSPEMIGRVNATVGISSCLEVKNDAHILMFYYGQGYDQNVYKVDEDTLAMISKRGDVLDIYGIWSTQTISIDDVLATLPLEGIKKVAFQMTPKLPVRGLHTTEDWSGNWMVRKMGAQGFPNGFRYPRISQA